MNTLTTKTLDVFILAVKLKKICQRGFTNFPTEAYERARQLIPFPALLSFIGAPLAKNQQCFWHQGSTGSSLSFFHHHETGHWHFTCNSKADCGLQGDVIEFWYRLVIKSGFSPVNWSRSRAVTDLLCRVRSNQIDISLTEFPEHTDKQGPPRPQDEYWERLKELKGTAVSRGRRLPLPQPVKISLREAILGIFPENGFLMMTNQANFHPIMRRDKWLAGRYHAKPTLERCCYVSGNYCATDNEDGTSYAAFEGIERRWLTIESDQGSLEEQFWIHRQLEKQFGNLGLICFSGGKSLHGWYLVEGWSLEECFQLYAKAVHLGVSDISTWKICQQVRLPMGWNQKTKKRQLVYVWNC